MDWFFLFLALAWVFWIISKGYKEGRHGDDDRPIAVGGRSTRAWGHRRPGPPTHRITYTDAEGNTTQRDIALYKSGHTNLKCEVWCAMRQARRTFLFARINSAIDLSTGEVLTRAGFFSAVHPGRKVPEHLL